ERVEVAAVVRHVLDLEGVELEAEALEVLVRLDEQALGELDPVAVDLLRREGGEHAAQGALERLARHPQDLLAAADEDALDGVADDRLGAGDLEVGDTLDVERDASLGVGALHPQVDDHVGEVHPVDPLEQRDADAAAALDEPVADLPVPDRAAGAGEDQDLVGRADVDEPRDDDDHHEDGEGEGCCEHDEGVHHLPPWAVSSPVPAARLGVSVRLRGAAAGAPVNTRVMSTPLASEISPISSVTVAGNTPT